MILGINGIISVSRGSSLNNNLYAVYNAESNANDSFGTLNGTAVGGLTYTTGKIGNAFNLNGTTSYIDMSDIMDVGTSSWSYSMWVNPSQLNSGTAYGLLGKIIPNYSSVGRVFMYFFSNKIQYGLEVSTTTTIVLETLNNFSINNWYNLVFIIDRNSNIKLYVNGVLDNSSILAGGSSNISTYSSINYNNTIPFRIGALTNSDNTSAVSYFNGKIDAVNIWQKVLTQSEITELYNSGNGAQYPY